MSEEKTVLASLSALAEAGSRLGGDYGFRVRLGRQFPDDKTSTSGWWVASELGMERGGATLLEAITECMKAHAESLGFRSKVGSSCQEWLDEHAPGASQLPVTLTDRVVSLEARVAALEGATEAPRP